MRKKETFAVVKKKEKRINHDGGCNQCMGWVGYQGVHTVLTLGAFAAILFLSILFKRGSQNTSERDATAGWL